MVKNVVLVHGAWADGSTFGAKSELLRYRAASACFNPTIAGSARVGT
jgi:hypothetical protein